MTDTEDNDKYENKKIAQSEIINEISPNIIENKFLSLKMKNLFARKIPPINPLNKEGSKKISKFRNSSKSMNKSAKKLNDFKDSIVTKPRPKIKKIIKNFYAPEKNPHILRYSSDIIADTVDREFRVKKSNIRVTEVESIV
jgi:hypothetical protein